MPPRLPPGSYLQLEPFDLDRHGSAAGGEESDELDDSFEDAGHDGHEESGQSGFSSCAFVIESLYGVIRDLGEPALNSFDVLRVGDDFDIQHLSASQ